MNLENSLKDLEQRAHRIRRWSLIASAGVVLCYVSILPLEMMFHVTKIPAIAPIWSILTTIVFFIAAVLLSLYWYKYRPALERKRVDLQTAMIAQLQQQLSEVIQRLDKQSQ